MNTHELKEILERLELNSLHSTVDFVDLYEAASRRPSFTFTGEFSSGKTSLIEQLLGETIGKVDILEATRLPILFVYGTQKQAYGFQNRKQVEMINFEELNVASGQLDSPYDWLLVSLPNETLKTFNIVDTPGTNGSSTHQVSFVPNLQYVFCSPYGEVMTETKQQTLQNLGNQDIYFVATKADLVDLDEQEEIEEVHEEILEDYSFQDQIIYSILDTEIIENRRDLRLYLDDWSTDMEIQHSKTTILAQIANTLNGELVDQVSKLLEIDNKMMSRFIISSDEQRRKEREIQKEHELFKQSVLDTWRVFYASNGNYNKNMIIQDIEQHFELYKKARYEPRLINKQQLKVIEHSQKNMMELKSRIIKLISSGMQNPYSWMYDSRRTEIMNGYSVKIDQKNKFIGRIREQSLHAEHQIQLMKLEEKELKNALEIFLDKRWYAKLKTAGSFTYDASIQKQYVFVPKLDVQNAVTTHSYITNITKLEQKSSNIRRSHMIQTVGNGVNNSPKTLKINFGLENLHGQNESSPWRANRLLLKQLKETKRGYLDEEREWFSSQNEHKKKVHQSYEVIGNKILILKQIINENIQSEIYFNTLNKLLNELQVICNHVKGILQSKTYIYDVSSEGMDDSPHISRMNYFIHQVMYPAFFVQSILLFVFFYIILSTDLISSNLGYTFPNYFEEQSFLAPLLGFSLIITYGQHRLEDRKHTAIPVTVNTLCGIATLFLIIVWLSENQ